MNIILIAIFLFYSQVLCRPDQASCECCASQFISKTLPDLNLPARRANMTVGVCQKNGSTTVLYSLYDPVFLHSLYSAYILRTQDMKQAKGGRINKFSLDPQLVEMKIPQIDPMDPKIGYGNTWNRGHLAPSKAMSYSNASWTKCYYGTNIAPQAGKFNQQGWRILEENVFKWVLANRDLYVITGVWYDPQLPINKLPGGVGIPDYYYKIICDPVGQQSAAFVGKNMINESGSDALVFYSVAQVEKRLRVNFRLADICKSSVVDSKRWWSDISPPTRPYTRPPTPYTGPPSPYTRPPNF